MGISLSAESDRGRCPLDTRDLFEKRSIKNFNSLWRDED